MSVDRQQRDIERDEQWLRRFETPGPPAEMLDRVKLAVRQAFAGDESETVPGTREAVAAAKSAVRKELQESVVRTVPTPRRRQWVRVVAAAAVVGSLLVGVRSEFITGVQEDKELQRLADVMDRDVSATDSALSELATEIEGLYEDAYGAAGASLSDSFLEGLDASVEDFLSELASPPETS